MTSARLVRLALPVCELYTYSLASDLIMCISLSFLCNKSPPKYSGLKHYSVLLLTGLQLGQGLEGMVHHCSMQCLLGRFDGGLESPLQAGSFAWRASGYRLSADSSAVAMGQASVPVQVGLSICCSGFLAV